MRKFKINFIIMSFIVMTVSAAYATETRNAAGMTELMVEAGRGNSAKVRELIKNGADLFATDKITGAAPLHFAVQGGNLETVKMLVESGAQINQQVASHGMTPLMVAIWHRNPEIVNYLLSLPDININIVATGGGNAERMIQGTKKSGQKTDELPDDGKKMLASLNKYKANYIKDPSHKLIITVTNSAISDDERAAQIEKLIKQGANVNYQQPNIQSNNDGHTALLIASRLGYDKTVKVLLENGADMTITGELMKAHPAHKAGYMGHPKVMALLAGHPDFKKIMDLQGPFNGYTALHDSVWHGSYECAKILVDTGANIHLKGWDGMTALDLAKKYGYKDIVELLEKE